MTKSFYMRDNKSAGLPFANALIHAGYERIENDTPESGLPHDLPGMRKADFFLLDHDWSYRKSTQWDASIKERPTFIYPHTPYSWFLWDGILPTQRVCCNFVVSEGAKEAMRLYGYKRPVEVIGFSNCEIQPFKPMDGTKLLFAPAHPVHDGKFPRPEGLQRVQRATHHIIKHLDYFESVTVRWHGKTLRDCGLEEFAGKPVNLENVDVYGMPTIREHALAAIARADLVVSESTFGYMAVASGKPTIFYGYDDRKIPDSREGLAKSYNRYKHIFHFPLSFEEMDIADILYIRKAPHPHIENWKLENIGKQFEAEKFVSILESYL